MRLIFISLCSHARLQVSDGAAVTLLMTRREAAMRGLSILGVFRSFAAVGVDPAIMGVGPAVAIPAAVKQAGLTLDDIDVYEINEAFASQALYCVRELRLPPEKACFLLFMVPTQ
jgi:acetyl-CoA acyltransferase 1